MNSSTCAIFAAVYLAVALFSLAMPAVAGFYLFASGVAGFKAFTPAPVVIRRSPFGYAR